MGRKDGIPLPDVQPVRLRVRLTHHLVNPQPFGRTRDPFSNLRWITSVVELRDNSFWNMYLFEDPVDQPDLIDQDEVARW
jgi:hypothetical protein